MFSIFCTSKYGVERMKWLLLYNQIFWTSKNELGHQLSSEGCAAGINIALNKKTPNKDLLSLNLT